MIVFKLDANHNPSTAIQDFDTLIWTERYLNSGDFKLVVEDRVDILTTLPTGSLISHSDTKEVMVVESHEIERDKDKNLLVTLTGRTLETFAEQRTTTGSAQPINTVEGVRIVETITGSAEYAAEQILKYQLVTGFASANNAVSNWFIQLIMRVTDTSLTYIIDRGSAYERVIELLRVSGAGIKSVRPNGAQTTMNIVIHDGLDKTASVIFQEQNEDLENAKYFWSIRPYKNYAQVSGTGHTRLYKNRDEAGTPTGIDRRIMYVDANDIEGDFLTPTSTDAIAARGQLKLDERPKMWILSAVVAPTTKYAYKTHYNMGDLVKVYGEFSLEQTMRVTEHILTVDKDGVRGNPSLSLP